MDRSTVCGASSLSGRQCLIDAFLIPRTDNKEGALQSRTALQKIEGRIRKANELYGLIEEGDRIGVGFSGGKDSLVLLSALHSLLRYNPVRYELVALTVDPQFLGKETDYAGFLPVLHSMGIPFHIRRSNIAEVVFETRQEKNPCSLCARMRRGILHDMAIETSCNKVALGHHQNDAVETLFLNLLHEGRLESFRPKTYLSRKDITVIRPLVLCTEREVQAASAALSVPPIASACPVDRHTERENIKTFLKEMEAKYCGFTERTFSAMQRGNISAFGTASSPEQNTDE